MLIKFIHTVFFYIIMVLSFFVGSFLATCAAPFSRSKTYPFQVVAHGWAKFLVFFSRTRMEVKGLENLPKNTPAILAPNHQSAADIMILLAGIPKDCRFAVKKELFRVPFFGWYLKMSGYFSIDREVVLSAYRTLEKIIEILKAGDNVLIFPEGTRSRDGSLGRFKRGSLLAALKSGAPIIPIAISGSFNIIPRGTWLIHPSHVKLSIGQPIYIKNETEYDQKVNEVRDTIARML